MITLAAGDYTATLAPAGAELQRFTWRGHELLWSGDPTWWARRAPLLFPVVGAVARGPLPKHGFARDRVWEVLATGPATARVRLADDAATREVYPHAFDLQLEVALSAQGLRMTAILRNPGTASLPAQFGFHPAFRWPLFPGTSREAHRLRFEAEEPGPLRQLQGDLLSPTRRPTPVVGREVALSDACFQEDALIWEAPRSRELHYGIPGHPELVLRWDLPAFACWTKPGAPFLCLEPWQGLADEVGASGDLSDRPGSLHLAPGAEQRWALEARIQPTLEGDPARSD